MRHEQKRPFREAEARAARTRWLARHRPRGARRSCRMPNKHRCDHRRGLLKKEASRAVLSSMRKQVVQNEAGIPARRRAAATAKVPVPCREVLARGLSSRLVRGDEVEVRRVNESATRSIRCGPARLATLLGLAGPARLATLLGLAPSFYQGGQLVGRSSCRNKSCAATCCPERARVRPPWTAGRRAAGWLVGRRNRHGCCAPEQQSRAVVLGRARARARGE
jgi:hypothetical protein